MDQEQTLPGAESQHVLHWNRHSRSALLDPRDSRKLRMLLPTSLRAPVLTFTALLQRTK